MNRLRDLRLEKNKLQNEIAKILNISTSGYSLYEIEKRDIPTEYLVKLATYYNTTTDYILGKSDIRTPIDLNNIKFANNGGLSTEGLTERDIEELKAQIEFKRKYNKERNNKNEM